MEEEENINRHLKLRNLCWDIIKGIKCHMELEHADTNIVSTFFWDIPPRLLQMTGQIIEDKPTKPLNFFMGCIDSQWWICSVATQDLHFLNLHKRPFFSSLPDTVNHKFKLIYINFHVKEKKKTAYHLNHKHMCRAWQIKNSATCLKCIPCPWKGFHIFFIYSFQFLGK